MRARARRRRGREINGSVHVSTVAQPSFGQRYSTLAASTLASESLIMSDILGFEIAGARPELPATRSAAAWSSIPRVRSTAA